MIGKIPARLTVLNDGYRYVKSMTPIYEANEWPIQYVQLDPNGLCNAKCWFCPVAYEGNPKSIQQNMSVEMLENILKQLADGRGDFVEKDMWRIVPYNFNEILLYPHFEEMLVLFKKYGFKMPISTNGVALTKSKVNTINKYPESVHKILLNVPSAFPEEWSKYTGFNEKIFDKVINNIQYAIDTLDFLTSQSKIQFIFNHIDEKAVSGEDGFIELMENSPLIDLNIDSGTAARTVKEFKKIFPSISHVENHEVLDRLGFLERLNIFTNAKFITENLKKGKTKVIGCHFDGDSQTENVLHINADGGVHLCCQDFNLESVYMNVKDATLKEIWHSQKRRNAINEAYSTFCQDCQYAVWE
jgi:radical SAM protein with 4Fe4S-binding SPASM domain